MTQATQTRGPQAAATAIKWRVGVRRTPRSRHDLIPCSLTAKETHPLALAAAFTGKESGSRVQVLPVSGADPVLMDLVVDPTSSGLDKPPLSKRKSSGNTAALVLLQDGDVDPLGVFASVGDTPSSSLESVATADKSAGLQLSSVSSVSGGVSKVREETAAPPTVKQQWKAHTDRLLAKFSDHVFKIKASEDAVEASVIKKTRARLEQLERVPSSSGSSSSGPFSRDEQTIELSQSQYVAKVKEMQTQLVANWQQNQKVAALRIAIKCVKLLADTNTAPQLYPCVFVLISEVLDTFGGLVFERIHTRASEDENGQPLPTPLGEHFTSSDVNIHAMETCRNWFYKTACIRELLPRM
ncbi:hypothetical protein BBJ28_00020010 [Nothophytophthora sp. Chile5]|nr:hypothetical protein BBJ28_00020010 [Nothophytophthora sp. Chile5]